MLKQNQTATLGVDRRCILRAAIGAIVGCHSYSSANEPGEADYLKAALEVARWLESCRLLDGDASMWPADPLNPKSVGPYLYSGVAGVTLFWLEAHRATGDKRFLSLAKTSANYLRKQIPDQLESPNCGLYTGLAGIGFVLGQVAEVIGAREYNDDARRGLRIIQTQAKEAGKGIEWSDVTDIIGGTAGIGLYLLHAARKFDDESYLKTATQAGHRLIELALEDRGALKWAMSPKFPRLMPNFSHGTAGVCYFLASLFRETKNRVFIETAIAGTNYLQVIADTNGDICRVFHHEPGGEDLYYLGWCHGPVGTARLFFRLYQVTGDDAWMEWVHRCATAISRSGIPKKQTPGFWNNVSQCCGSAGVADFFLSLYRLTKKQEYLTFCETMTADLMSRAKRDNKGYRWVQAEHRVKPQETVAQTGYMQGAAGIGMLLLRLDAYRRGLEPLITFPDSPF
jgi:lantibiotic modifying enzyme